MKNIMTKKQLERRVRALERTLKSEKEYLVSVLTYTSQKQKQLTEESIKVMMALSGQNKKSIKTALKQNSCKMFKVNTSPLGRNWWISVEV